MNKTRFALNHLFTNQALTSLPTVKLFLSEEMAYDSLFHTLMWRFTDAYPDLVAEQMTLNGVVIDPTNQDQVSETVYNYANENGCKAAIMLLAEWEDGELLYSVQKVRTMSFIEEASEADLVEIDDYSIRHFYVASEQLEDPAVCRFLDAETVDSDGNSVSFDFTYTESTDAQYNFDAEHWVVKSGNQEYFVKFFKFK